MPKSPTPSFTKLPCDVVITPDQRVFINGHQIGGVMGIDMEAEAHQLTNLTLRINPSSLVVGDPPTDSLGGLSDVYDDQDGEARVDIGSAIAKARRRLARKDDSNKLTTDDEAVTVSDPDRNNDPFKHD